MDQHFLDVITRLGYQDGQCNKIVFGEAVKELTKPGERMMYDMLRDMLSKEEGVEVHDVEDWDFPTHPLPPSYQYKMMAAFVGMNVLKVLRTVGLRVGPDFIDHIRFPIWRPSVWTTPKCEKYWGFIGIPQPDVPDAPHPFDYARSTRFNTSVMIRECPDPEILSSDDYEKHHAHGLLGLAHMLALSFIDVDPVKRVFRFYCIQGCSRLYHFDEVLHDRKVLEAIKSKIIVKGRIPRTVDFVCTTRQGWDDNIKPIIKKAQHRILSLMPNLAPLLPIKMSLADIAHHCVMDIAPIILAQFLDGRTGMSYGFLAFQLPTGPVESCQEIKVLCTRSGCDKQHPDENKDWVVLSCDTDNLYLDQAAEMLGTTSPSFDSWLILAQAAANVALAKRFKEEGRCAAYVDMVENQGIALCHFHGFIKRDAVPKEMGFFGQDQLPLPCGSVESAFLTVREKRNMAEKVVACEQVMEYKGDIHVEPDHGSVVSCGFDMLEQLTDPRHASYGLVNFDTYKDLTWDPTI